MQRHIKKLLESNFLYFLLRKSKWLYLGCFFTIAILTLVPSSTFPTISWNFISIDKLAHIIMFTALTFLGLVSSIYETKNISKHWSTFICISTAVIYGYMIELIQSYIPSRSYDFADFTADVVGVLVGYSLFLLCEKFLPKNYSN